MHNPNKFRSYLIALVCFIPAFLGAQNYTQTLKGTLLDRALKTPLTGATVVLLAADGQALSGTTTDVDGRFRFAKVPVGKQTLRASYLGYKEQFFRNITVNSGKEADITIELEEDLQQIAEAVITAKIEKQKPLNELSTVSARTFSVEETQRFAAAVNDPARMASSFAGVVTRGDGNNIINIRGNSSNGLLWRMEGVEIPNPNHFSAVGSSGGGISILSAQLLSNSDFLTGAFAAEYGNALSGVFDMRLRKGNSEKREFTLQAGLLGLDAAVEGPLPLGRQTGSYLVNYRYSTLSLISKIGVNIGDAVTDFQDLSFNIWLPTAKMGAFTLFGIGGLSTQTLEGTADSLLWKENLDKQYDFNFTANTGVAGLTHSLILGEKTYLKTVAAFSGTKNRDFADQFQFDYALRQLWDKNHANTKFTFSTVLTHKFNARHLLRTGAYHNLLHYDLYQSNWKDAQESLVREIQQKGNTETLQAFAQWQYRASEKLTLNAGSHALFFFLNNKVSIEPRAALKYAFSARQSLSFGYGLHSQMQPLGVYFAQNSLASNPQQALNANLGLTKAHHYVLSFDQSLPGNLHLKTEAYCQDLRQVPVSKTAATAFSMLNLEMDYPTEALANTGRGRNYGIELTFEKFLTKGLYFLLATSLYESKYRGSDLVWRDTRYNGGYANSLVAGKEWGWNRRHKNRAFGVNLKLTQMGGLRETPLDLAASRAKGETVRDESRAFESQLPAYFRLDLGLRLKRNYKALTSTLSLDIQNTTNRQNVYTQYYDRNTLDLKYYYQTPLIPILSYKVEF